MFLREGFMIAGLPPHITCITMYPPVSDKVDLNTVTLLKLSLKPLIYFLRYAGIPHVVLFNGKIIQILCVYQKFTYKPKKAHWSSEEGKPLSNELVEFMDFLCRGFEHHGWGHVYVPILINGNEKWYKPITPIKALFRNWVVPVGKDFAQLFPWLKTSSYTTDVECLQGLLYQKDKISFDDKYFVPFLSEAHEEPFVPIDVYFDKEFYTKKHEKYDKNRYFIQNKKLLEEHLKIFNLVNETPFQL